MAAELELYVICILYLLKNSLTVKKGCGPVQNDQCEKSYEIKGVAKKWL